MELMEPVDEMRFEISTDVHGTAEGPRLGRLRVINKVSIFRCYVLHLVSLSTVTANNISTMQ